MHIERVAHLEFLHATHRQRIFFEVKRGIRDRIGKRMDFHVVVIHFPFGRLKKMHGFVFHMHSPRPRIVVYHSFLR